MLMEPVTRTQVSIRLAQTSDISAVQDVIEQSARKLLRNHYTGRQIEAILSNLIGVDPQLIDDGTYYVAEIGGRVVAAGGWSYRSEVVGTHTSAESTLAEGDDSARIRLMFVHPDFAGQGVGSELLHVSEAAAYSCGFYSAKLMATLTGVPFYIHHGWKVLETVDFDLPGGVGVTGVSMTKALG